MFDIIFLLLDSWGLLDIFDNLDWFNDYDDAFFKFFSDYDDDNDDSGFWF